MTKNQQLLLAGAAAAGLFLLMKNRQAAAAAQPAVLAPTQTQATQGATGISAPTVLSTTVNQAPVAIDATTLAPIPQTDTSGLLALPDWTLGP